jgi:hypothetical protein
LVEKSCRSRGYQSTNRNPRGQKIDKSNLNKIFFIIDSLYFFCRF